MWDTGGRAFTDFTMGWGSVLLGHAHPAVTAAVVAQAARGANFAYVSEPALVLAEESGSTMSRARSTSERSPMRAIRRASATRAGGSARPQPTWPG